MSDRDYDVLPRVTLSETPPPAFPTRLPLPIELPSRIRDGGGAEFCRPLPNGRLTVPQVSAYVQFLCRDFRKGQTMPPWFERWLNKSRGGITTPDNTASSLNVLNGRIDLATEDQPSSKVYKAPKSIWCPCCCTQSPYTRDKEEAIEEYPTRVATQISWNEWIKTGKPGSVVQLESID